MSLRADVIESGARNIFYSGERTQGLVWHSTNDDQRRLYMQLSRDALDGHLEALAARADEWDRLASAGESTTDDLIAVLRPTEGET